METVKLADPKKMAEILGVPVSWIYQRTCIGQTAIPHIKMGKYLRFFPEEVIAFFKKKGRIRKQSKF